MVEAWISAVLEAQTAQYLFPALVERRVILNSCRLISIAIHGHLQIRNVDACMGKGYRISG
jgi:hypothetical protein